MHWTPSLFQHNVPLGFNLRTKDRFRFIIGPKEICSLDAHFFGVPRAHPGRSPADLFWPVVAFHFLLDWEMSGTQSSRECFLNYRFYSFFPFIFQAPTHTNALGPKIPVRFFHFLGRINDHPARPRDVGGTHPRPSPKWGVESSFSRPWLIGGSVGRLGSFRLLITDTLRTYCLVAK